jgi:predicted Zn-dependent protease with MMP-like domain
MERVEFEELVARAVNNLPEEFQDRLENVDIVVADQPTRYQLSKSDIEPGNILLGLYEGIPQTERGSHYGMVPPDKITIFQKSIEAVYHEEHQIIREIERVVKHEIAHHFGIGDARLDEIEGNRED